jgi:signal transduction histidine kinase
MERGTNFGQRLGAFFALPDRFIPNSLRADPENFRRARLINRFGVLGSLFGIIFSMFYLAVGHTLGAAIVIVCTLGMAVTPLLMRWKKSTEPAGHFFTFIMTAGFVALNCCEGGMHGHAIAWLVSVPLCALLLLGVRAATLWLGIALLATGIIVGCDFAGITLPKTYPLQWDSVISAAGYLGLVLFMAVLGLVFETGRAKAYASLQAALKELRQSNDQLVVLNQEKTEFLGIAAHDLKNPLSAIMASGELMREFTDPDALHKIAETISQASERMYTLIKDLLDANAIEEGRFTSNVAACDFGQQVSQIIEQNRFSAEKKRIEIRTGLTAGLLVHTDAAASLQILDNLISNAVKYSPHNTTIHVHLVPEMDYAMVMVRDEGPGISEEDQKKLFQKYSRLTARPTAGESSTGLGLSIAKRLAIKLGGDILCHSSLGAGTTFTFRLPLSREKAAVAIPLAHDATDIIRERETYVSSRN